MVQPTRSDRVVEAGNRSRASAQYAITVLEQDAPKPARKCCRLAEIGQRSKGCEKRLLRGVLGEVIVA